MSSFREATEKDLVCPKHLGGCGSMNRDNVTVIEAIQNYQHAYCSVCSYAGPIEHFKRSDR